MLEKPPLNHFPLIPVILSEFKLNLLLRLVTERDREEGRERGRESEGEREEMSEKNYP